VVASQAAALLVAPGMRQPVAMELRGNDEVPTTGPESERLLRSLSQAAGQAVGNKLKVEPLRIRISMAGCANLDVVDLPEKTTTHSSSKVEEMRTNHVGSTSNLLVCLEPGSALEICRRFDPLLKRTLLVGAAVAEAQAQMHTIPPHILCGKSAARDLETRFATLCQERVSTWLQSLDRLEANLLREQKKAREAAQQENPNEILTSARNAGICFNRAVQYVDAGFPGCTSGELTLEQELVAFAAEADALKCEIMDGKKVLVSSAEVAAAAGEVFSNYGGAAGYAKYLREKVYIEGAEYPLNGGAMWPRMLAEIRVALLLTEPDKEDLANMKGRVYEANGYQPIGDDLPWKEVCWKVIEVLSDKPLRSRVTYIVARMVWVLKHQKVTVSELIDASGRRDSQFLPAQLDVLKNSPLIRELVFATYDKTVSSIGAEVLEYLLFMLTARPNMLRPADEGSQSPAVPMDKARPSVHAVKEGDEVMDDASAVSAAGGSEEQKLENGQALTDRDRRVMKEMQEQMADATGLPVGLRHQSFDLEGVEKHIRHVERNFHSAFRAIKHDLSLHAHDFGHQGMTHLCNRFLDEAMAVIDFTPTQQRAMAEKYEQLEDSVKLADQRLVAIRRCGAALRSGFTSSMPRL